MLGSEVVEGWRQSLSTNCPSRSVARRIILIVEVSEAVAGVARTYRASAMRLRMRRWRTGDLGPAHFEETAHPVAGLAHRTVVLVEYLAVDEHLPDIGAKLIARLVPASREYPL